MTAPPDIDDSEFEQVYLVVRYADGATGRLGPSDRGFAEAMKAGMDEQPAEGYVSATIEPVEEEGEE